MATGGYPNEDDGDDYDTESDDAALDLGDGPDAAEKTHFLEVCLLVVEQGKGVGFLKDDTLQMLGEICFVNSGVIFQNFEYLVR